MLCDQTVIRNLIEKYAFRTVRIEPKIDFLLWHDGWNGFVCLKGKARTPTDDLIPNLRLGTHWPFRYSLLVKMSIGIASSSDVSGTG